MLVEAEKCSGAIRKAMENGGIAYCYLDRFCTGNSNQIKETAMLQAVQRILDEEVQLNLHDVMNEAYLQTRAGMTTASAASSVSATSSTCASRSTKQGISALWSGK